MRSDILEQGGTALASFGFVVTSCCNFDHCFRKSLIIKMERAKGFESVRGAVAHAMMCKNGPIYASRDARQPARCCTDPRDFYRKLSQKSGAGSQVSWQKDRVTFRTSVWRRFHRGRHLSDPAALAHTLGSQQDSGRCFRSPLSEAPQPGYCPCHRQ